MPLLQTPIFSWHVEHGGRMVDFAGWSLPVQYASIVQEHQATRQSVAVFDVSHMGRFRITGPDAQRLVDRLLTRRTDNLASGRIRYALITNTQGGVLDDVLIYRLPPSTTPTEYYLVVNASNRLRIADWIASQSAGGFDAQVTDETQGTAMMAVQGPHAMALGSQTFSEDLNGLPYYTCHARTWRDHPVLISRTGYTGEDGWEIVIPASVALPFWESLWERGQASGLQAAGLGARDTLRLEAGMPLYGHELSEDLNPFQAGLAFAVDLEGRQFPGRDALAALQPRTDLPVRVGLALTGRRAARQGDALRHEGASIGHVTSGSFSPTLGYPIAMANVSPACAKPGSPCIVDTRGHEQPATVVPLPFYRRAAVKN